MSLKNSSFIYQHIAILIMSWFIFKGNSVHHINKNELPYKTGDLFLISPEDEQCFEIRKVTRFAFIKFAV
jgi:hypothetical protein